MRNGTTILVGATSHTEGTCSCPVLRACSRMVGSRESINFISRILSVNGVS